MNKMLIIVDPQVDFINGSLPVNGSAEAMDSLAEYVKGHGDEYMIKIVTSDWHPYRHCSFDREGGQWPPHCIQHSVGAAIWQSLLVALSKFRSSFYLNKKDKEYIHEKGWTKIEQGAREIIAKRLAPAYIPNDGKQTPMRHGIFPPFIAQHATGCCCRNCLQKWHGIPKGRQLTPSEQGYVVDVIMEWLHRHCE